MSRDRCPKPMFWGRRGRVQRTKLRPMSPPLPVWEKFPASIADFFWPKKHQGRGEWGGTSRDFFIQYRQKASFVKYGNSSEKRDKKWWQYTGCPISVNWCSRQDFQRWMIYVLGTILIFHVVSNLESGDFIFLYTELDKKVKRKIKNVRRERLKVKRARKGKCVIVCPRSSFFSWFLE